MIKETLNHVYYTVEHDQDPLHPRNDFDNLTTIALTNNRYLSGDIVINETIQQHITTNKDIIYKPIFAYIHSGIALAFTPFSCPWDSGQIGYIYTDKQRIKKEYNVVQWRKKAIEIINAEFNSFKLYVEGENYIITVYDLYTDNYLDLISYTDDIEAVKTEAKKLAEYWDNKRNCTR